MNLLYITNSRIPTEKAHGLQIIKMCEAFQRQNWQVELFVPFRVQSSGMKRIRNIWEHYDVTTPFRIRHVFAPDFLSVEEYIPAKIFLWFYYLQSSLFSLLAFIMTAFRRESVYYSRDLPTVFLLCLTKFLHRKKIFFEAHELHGEPHKRGTVAQLAACAMRWMLRHVDGVIAITHRLKTLYVNMGMRESDILVAPDGIDAAVVLGLTGFVDLSVDFHGAIIAFL